MYQNRWKKCRGVLLGQKNRAGINYRNNHVSGCQSSGMSHIFTFFVSLLNYMECIKSSGYDGYLQALIMSQRLSRKVSETGIWEHFSTSFQSIQIATNNFLVLCDLLSLPAACGPTAALSSQSFKCWKKESWIYGCMLISRLINSGTHFSCVPLCYWACGVPVKCHAWEQASGCETDLNNSAGVYNDVISQFNNGA